jgi:hypothetical protein
MTAVGAAACGCDHAPVYSNLPGVAAGWITVISFSESNPEAGKHAFVDALVGLALSVLDVLDGGGGVYP